MKELARFLLLWFCVPCDAAIETVSSSFNQPSSDADTDKSSACVNLLPVPPVQTQAQIDQLAWANAQAKPASDAATPHVLDLFRSEDFRTAMQNCCPRAAALSPAELLSQFRAELRASEMAHAFPVVSDHGATTPGEHFNVELGIAYGFMLNSYQATIARAASISCPWRVSDCNWTKWVDPTNEAEIGIFHNTPFKNASAPTWLEASERPQYVANNFRRVDFGSNPFFGEASVMFNRQYVKNMVIIAPIDTGMWEMSCNTTSPPWHALDCKVWRPTTVGTWEHFDHIILANLGIWRTSSGNLSRTLVDEAKEMFARSVFGPTYLETPAITSLDTMKYWETNIAGNVRFPDGVDFLIGSFHTLFGTTRGLALRLFADKFGWPLVWALATKSTTPTQMNSRVLDPSLVVSGSLNVSAPGDKNKFWDLWLRVERERKAGKARFREWWNAFETTQTRLEPVTAVGCGSAIEDSFFRCVGIEIGSGRCVCTKQVAQVPVYV